MLSVGGGEDGGEMICREEVRILALLAAVVMGSG